MAWVAPTEVTDRPVRDGRRVGGKRRVKADRLDTSGPIGYRWLAFPGRWNRSISLPKRVELLSTTQHMASSRPGSREDSSKETALSQAQLDAILSLAAAGGPSSSQPPTPSESKLPPPRAVRIAVWDEKRGVKFSGTDAPTEDSLAAYLATHPRCHVFSGQQPVEIFLKRGLEPAHSWNLPKPNFAIPGTADVLCARKRCQFTEAQLARLLDEFGRNELPQKEGREALAAELGLTPRSVQVWFQNRRQRARLGQARVHAMDPPPRGMLSELALVAELEHGRASANGPAFAAAPPSTEVARPIAHAPKVAAPACTSQLQGHVGREYDNATPSQPSQSCRGASGEKVGDKDDKAREGARRTDLSAWQTAALVHQFEKVDKFPGRETREKLAAELNMTLRAVQAKHPPLPGPGALSLINPYAGH